MNNSGIFEDENIKIHLSWSHFNSSFISIIIDNKTKDRVYIEWENARLNGSNLAFSNDRKILLNNPKQDEVVHSQTQSILREIMRRDFAEEGFFPQIENGTLILPVRIGNHTIDYKLTYALYNSNDNIPLEVGMTQKKVKELRGSPDRITKNGNYENWYYLNYYIVFMNKKIMEIKNTIDIQLPSLLKSN